MVDFNYQTPSTGELIPGFLVAINDVSTKPYFEGLKLACFPWVFEGIQKDLTWFSPCEVNKSFKVHQLRWSQESSILCVATSCLGGLGGELLPVKIKRAKKNGSHFKVIGRADSLLGVAWILGKNNGRAIHCAFSFSWRTWSRLLCAAV